MGSFCVGLDLGQVNDYSALAVVERVRVLPPGMGFEHYQRRVGREPITVTEELRVRHLQRWALGTPYPDLVDEVCALMAGEELRRAWLFVDGTGVGVAVKDLFRAAYTGRLMGHNWPINVTITGGEKGTGYHLPKRDLLSAVQVPLQQGRLKVAAGLALGAVLERELTSFRMKLSTNGHDSYDVVRREGEGHGDLVIALALACRWPSLNVEPELEESVSAVGDTS